MNRDVNILIQKLSSSGDTAEHAADALIDQVRRHGAKLDPVVDQLASHLNHPNFSVRAAVSRVLGGIGTTRAVDAIVIALMSTPDNELNQECGFSCWIDEPLQTWFISSISQTENEYTARVLHSLIKSPTLPETAKITAVEQLKYYDLDECDITLARNIDDVLAEFGLSSDSDTDMDEGFYVLRDSAFDQNWEAVQQIVKDNPSILEATNSLGETALHFLVVENQLEAVEGLVREGADVNGKSDAILPIEEAARMGYVEMVDLLIRLGANVNPKEIMQQAGITQGKRTLKRIKATLEGHGYPTQ